MSFAARRILFSSAACIALLPGAGFAQALKSTAPRHPLGTLEIIQLSIFAGVMGAALLSAIWLIRERGRIAAENLDLRGRIAELGGALQRAEATLNLRDQRIVVWANENRRPELMGVLAADTGAPEDRSAFLAFGRWLTPRSAAAVEHAVMALRDRGTGFDLVVETQAGGLLEVHGQTSAGHAIVRFVSPSQAHRSHLQLKAEHQRLLAEYFTMRGLVESLPLPFWLRAADGRLPWVNRSYAKAVDA